MAIYKFPNGGDKDKDKESTTQGPRKSPEVIVIDADKSENHEQSQRTEDFSNEFRRIKVLTIPLRLRIFCLSLGILALLGAIGSALCFGVTILAACLTFYRLPSLNHLALNFWTSLKRASLFSFALILSFFSPYLGIGLIMMYFMMQDASVSESPLSRILRSNLKDYMGPRH